MTHNEDLCNISKRNKDPNEALSVVLPIVGGGRRELLVAGERKEYMRACENISARVICIPYFPNNRTNCCVKKKKLLCVN